jgi:hypothetical protein
MEELDPTRKIELQRNVEILDQELSKWSDELPGKYTIYAFRILLNRLGSGIQVSSYE